MEKRLPFTNQTDIDDWEGETWHISKWNPPGSYGGVPISIAVHPSNPDIIYIATLFSGVFRSTDGGKNWVAMNNGLTNLDIRSIAIDPDYPDQIYTGIENEGL